jgi:hypothetical protein
LSKDVPGNRREGPLTARIAVATSKNSPIIKIPMGLFFTNQLVIVNINMHSYNLKRSNSYTSINATTKQVNKLSPFENKN